MLAGLQPLHSAAAAVVKRLTTTTERGLAEKGAFVAINTTTDVVALGLTR